MLTHFFPLFVYKSSQGVNFFFIIIPKIFSTNTFRNTEHKSYSIPNLFTIRHTCTRPVAVMCPPKSPHLKKQRSRIITHSRLYGQYNTAGNNPKNIQISKCKKGLANKVCKARTFQFYTFSLWSNMYSANITGACQQTALHLDKAMVALSPSSLC